MVDNPFQPAPWWRLEQSYGYSLFINFLQNHEVYDPLPQPEGDQVQLYLDGCLQDHIKREELIPTNQYQNVSLAFLHALRQHCSLHQWQELRLLIFATGTQVLPSGVPPWSPVEPTLVNSAVEHLLPLTIFMVSSRQGCGAHLPDLQADTEQWACGQVTTACSTSTTLSSTHL